MIKYKDLVDYIKEYHVNWETDLFDVLKGFFNQYAQQAHSVNSPTPKKPIVNTTPPSNGVPKSDVLAQQARIAMGWKIPEDGEYSNEDLLNLFST